MSYKAQQLAATGAALVGIVMVVGGVPYGSLALVGGILWFVAARIMG